MIAAVLCSLLLTTHPGHATLAEMEFNATTGRIEVALRVNPAPLEPLLLDAEGKKVALEDVERADPLIRKWLAGRFVLSGADGKALATTWIGRELVDGDLWLYFEVPSQTGFVGLALANTLFMDGDDTQVNTIRMKDARWRRTLTFTTHMKTRTLRRAAKPVGGR